MVFEFKFPDVGEGITEGKLIRWLVKEKDSVKKEQNIAEVETDKAVVDIPSPINGVISKLLYNEHDTMYVGKPMMLIDDGTTTFNISSDVKQTPPLPSPVKYYQKETLEPIESKSQTKSVPIQNVMPQYSISILPQEVKALPMVRRYAKEKGIDLSTIKGTGFDGSITMKDLGGNKNVQLEPIYEKFTKLSISQSLNNQKADSNIMPQSFQKVNKDILASPSTRQYARELGMDISNILGTGNNEMITRDDVLNASKDSDIQATQTIKKSVTSKSVTSIMPQQVISSSELEDIMPMNAIRQIIAKKLSESMSKTVQYTVSDEFDVTDLCALRDKNAPELEKRGLKLTYLSFFVKAAALALIKNPYINSTLDESSNSIKLKKYYNIGIAVDTDRGLMVPVLKNVEHRTIIDIAASIADLAARARNKTIKPDELTGGTFSITNVGSLAGQMFTPVINYPESAILGIGRIIDKPVVRDGQIAIRKMATLSLTADHRIIDGANASRFLMTLREYIENPGNMLISP